VSAPGYAEAATVAGDALYVAAGDQGLQVYAHRAAQPVELGAARLDGYAEAVAVQGRYAFVAAGMGGLQVLDVIDPARPTLAATLGLPGYALDVAVAGDAAYVIDRYHGLAIVDIAQPAAPVLVGRLATPGFTHNISLDTQAGPNGRAGWVTTAPHGEAHLLDLADPARPAAVARFDTPDQAWRLAVHGDMLYVADRAGGLVILRRQPAPGPATF
jgi:hypothetical protein